MDIRFRRLIRLLVVTCLGGLLVALGQGGTAQATTWTHAGASSRSGGSLDEAVRALEGTLSAPGAAWVVSDGTTSREGGRGTDRRDRPITVDSAFLWGSVSKPVAGLVAARLSCEGTLSLERPVTDLLPTYRPADDRARRITVRQLLDHTSGIAPLLDQLDDDTPGRELTTAVAAIAAEPLKSDPGSRSSYSSANYVLLSAVLASVTGHPYAHLVSAELAARGIGDGVLDRSSAQRHLVGGHQYFAGLPVRGDDGFDEQGLAYGYLGGSVHQLAALGRSVADDLHATASAGSCDPTALSVSDPAPLPNGDGYALGWRVTRWNDQQVLWHGGAVDGYSSFLAVLPESGRVVAVLQDAYSPLLDDRLITPGVAATNVLVGNAAPSLPFPLVYVGCGLAALVVALMVAVLTVRPPAGRSGRIARIILGTLVAGLALATPYLAGPGSARAAWRWAPDVSLAVAVLALLGLALVVRTSLRGRRGPHLT